MERSLLQRMIESKKSNEVSHVSFFNDGKVRTDTYESNWRIDTANRFLATYDIERFLCEAVKQFSCDHNVDRVDMGLSLGLIFDKADVDDNNNIKAGAKPIENVVRYYSETAYGYVDGKVVDETRKCPTGIQGYVGYDKLISMVEDGGLKCDCPKTFEEFKNAILSGEKFAIVVTADLREKSQVKEEPMVETIVEEPIVEPVIEQPVELAKEKAKRLVIPLFRRR